MLAWTIYISFLGAALLMFAPGAKPRVARFLALATALAGLAAGLAGIVQFSQGTPGHPGRQLTEVVNADARFRRQDGGVVEQDLVGLGQLLEAGGGRHGIAGQGHRSRARHIPKSGHNLARGDADAQLHGLVVPGHVARQGGLHLECAQAGS